MSKYIVYTDGGCSPNPGGPGGCGIVILYDNKMIQLSYGYYASTNNRMEMRAVIHALTKIPKDADIDLFSDSQYVIRTLEGEYNRKKNLDLWQQLDELVKDYKSIKYHWVRGHSGRGYNEACDQLATMALQNPTLVDKGYDGKPIFQNASDYQQVKIDDVLYSVYCQQSFADELNAVGKKNINKFKDKKKHVFKDYIALKTGGRDGVSAMSEDDLKEFIGFDGYQIVCHYFSDKETIACMRWFVRGLSLGDAIRKVQADVEVSQNALKSKYKNYPY